MTGGQVHQVGQGLADNGVQGEEDKHGQHAPKAAAHGVDLFPLVELLNLQIVLVPVIAVHFLELLHLAVEHVHLDHGPLGLDGQGEQNDLDQHGEENQGHAVVVKELVKEHQDPYKRGQEKLNSLH